MRALRPVILFSPARHAELELDSRLWTATAIAKSMLWFVLWHMKSSDAKASECRLEFSSKWAFCSGCYVYVQLFLFNGNENNLFIAVKVKLPKLPDKKILILEDIFK